MFFFFPDISGLATCDNTMWLYANDQLVAYDPDWPTATPVVFPDSTTVIGIECDHYAGSAGIKARFDNGVVTDSTWRCSTSFEQDWLKPG